MDLIKRNIAFVLPMGLTLGGSNIWSLQMAEALQQAGRSSVLLRHPPVGEPYEIDPPAGVKCIHSSRKHGSRLTKRSVLSLSKCYGKSLPAVVIPNITTASYAACARLSIEHAEDMRMVGVAHGQGELHLKWLGYYEQMIQKFIAVSDEVAADLLGRIPHRANDVVVRACPVDVPSVLDRKYSAAGDPLRLVYAGRLTNFEKRVYKLLPLAEALQDRGVDFKLRIIGDGGFRWGLNKAICELPVELRQRISLEDPVSPKNLPAVWSGSDVCVLVSDREGTAVSMLEAMARGCVPVVTRVSGTAAVIEHGVNGFVSEIDDLEMMADHIQKLAGNRKLLAECGKRGHQKMAENYSLRDYLVWFLKLLDEVWAEPPRGWDLARPVIMPNPPDIRPGPWTRLKRMLCAKRQA